MQTLESKSESVRVGPRFAPHCKNVKISKFSFIPSSGPDLPKTFAGWRLGSEISYLKMPRSCRGPNNTNIFGSRRSGKPRRNVSTCIKEFWSQLKQEVPQAWNFEIVHVFSLLWTYENGTRLTTPSTVLAISIKNSGQSGSGAILSSYNLKYGSRKFKVSQKNRNMVSDEIYR